MKCYKAKHKIYKQKKEEDGMCMCMECAKYTVSKKKKKR